MSDVRETKSRLRKLQQIKTWQLLILLVMVGFVAATFLRLNNVGMVQRREAVLAADESGDTVALEQRLYDLQRYVSSHMNADPGRIALEKSYERASQAALKRFEQEAQNRASNDVVAKVRAVCDAAAQAGGYGHFRTTADPRYVNCINEEWAKYPAASETSLEFSAPATEPYYHTFISPLWSPDFAGWSVLICLLIVLVIIARLITLGVLKLLIKWQYRRA